MKEYKMVEINEGVRLSRAKDIKVSEEVLNKYISEGWILQQIVSPSDGLGSLIAIFYKEKP